MKFYQKLREDLKGKLPEKELELLPRSYQIVGKDLLIKLKPKLLKRKRIIGSAIMDILPYLHNVCLIREISGIRRKPRIEVIAGCKETQVLHKEHGCSFLLDMKEFMWSKGNKAEKLRLIKLVKPKETIVDMFAGIGYWSIPIAKFTKAKKIYAIDINLKAAEYLQKNVWLNNTSDKIEVLNGDCRNFADILPKADRIIMGYLFRTENFLPAALAIAKNNCTIHFHRTLSFGKKAFMERNLNKLKKKLIIIAAKNNCRLKFMHIEKVKSYAPNIWHIVMDLKIRKV